jgi:hypothetical protein
MASRDSEPNATIGTLALRCLAHLEKEDAMLQASRELVLSTRQALLHRDQQRLQLLFDQQRDTATAAQRLRDARTEIRRQIAACFSIPESRASLRFLAEQASPAQRQRLLNCRQRLHDLAEQVDTLNRGNVALAGQLLALLHGILHRLTGENPQPECYQRSGKRDASRNLAGVDHQG